ncbi:uncharacterized protein [Notothenia coriiceps]|uniref:Arf-GAP domain-containing protein n=1 Tax=Notothenia coriiceps TaxID=8208 RepID=A0A6I9PGE2_9TELE|nr:PREDICTED: uncharacterized protein LOC104959817 [Notothenia coriiceps]
MATSAKRKQEETHLKMLREMTSLPANRKCFDCDQRGPTYVNMTVGSFVCTTCSGIFVRQGTDRTPQSVMGLSRYATDLALCGSEEFWEQAVDRRCNTVSPGVASLALEVGWRSIFFTSKLQLQKLISRRRLKAEEPPEGQLSDPDIKAEESLGDNSEIDQASGSEKESPPGIIPKLSLGTDPGAGFDHSSYCDVDPESDLEAGSDSSVPALCQLFEETGKPCVETTEQDSAPNNSRGDFSAEPDKP